MIGEVLIVLLVEIILFCLLYYLFNTFLLPPLFNILDIFVKKIFFLLTICFNKLYEGGKYKNTLIQKSIKYWQLSSFVILMLSILWIYSPAFNGYFQQDEWYFMVQLQPLMHQNFLIAFVKAFISGVKDLDVYAYHFTPMQALLYWLEFRLFALHYIYYITLSITTHIVISFLVLRFTYFLTKNKLIALLAGLFFGLSFSHSEAVTWIGTHTNTQGALLFALISILFLLTYLKNHHKVTLLASLFFLVLSFFTKETAVFLIFFIPIVVATYFGFGKLKMLIPFYLTSLCYILIRLFVPSYIASLYHLNTITGVNADMTPLNTLYYAAVLLLKVVAQSFFSGFNFPVLAELLTDMGYPQYNVEKAVRGTNYLIFTQSAGIDIVYYFLALIFITLICVYIAVHIVKKSYLVKPFLIAVVLLVLSILPFTVLTGWLLKVFSYVTSIDSRHLYFTNVGVSIISAILIYNLYKFLKKKFYIATFIPIVTMLLLIFFWTMLQTQAFKREFTKQNTYAYDRKNIISFWLAERPKLQKQNIFYSESNVALYGFAEYMLPFQNNQAQILLGTYGFRTVYPKAFFDKKLLNKGITEQWYVSDGNLGLGYFLDKKSLLRATIEHTIPIDAIVAVKYDGKEHTVTSATSDIRSFVQNYLERRNKLLQSGWQSYFNVDADFGFLYPPGYEVVIDNNQDGDIISTLHVASTELHDELFSLIQRKRIEGEGISNYVESTTDEGDNIVGKNYTFVALKVGATDTYTAVYVKGQMREAYFFNTKVASEIKEIRRPSDQILSDEKKEMLENIFQFFEFYK